MRFGESVSILVMALMRSLRRILSTGFAPLVARRMTGSVTRGRRFSVFNLLYHRFTNNKRGYFKKCS